MAIDGLEMSKDEDFYCLNLSDDTINKIEKVAEKYGKNGNEVIYAAVKFWLAVEERELYVFAAPKEGDAVKVALFGVGS